MGQRGSDVSREVADVVLMDDNFATIVAAIEEGRNIYENIQKFIRFFFSTDLALILLMTAGLGLAFLLGIKDPAGGTFLLPLTAVQLLWINFVADGPPALAMALDRNPGVMDRPPRAPTAKLLDAASLRFVVISAAAKAVVGVAIIAALPQLGSSLEETRTSLFLYESVLQLVFAYPSRRIGVRAAHQCLGSPCRLARRCPSGTDARRCAAAGAARPRADQLGDIHDHHVDRIVDVGLGGDPLSVGGRRNPVETRPRAWQERLIAIRTTVRGPISAPRESGPPRRP